MIGASESTMYSEIRKSASRKNGRRQTNTEDSEVRQKGAPDSGTGLAKYKTEKKKNLISYPNPRMQSRCRIFCSARKFGVARRPRRLGRSPGFKIGHFRRKDPPTGTWRSRYRKGGRFVRSEGGRGWRLVGGRGWRARRTVGGAGADRRGDVGTKRAGGKAQRYRLQYRGQKCRAKIAA